MGQNILVAGAGPAGLMAAIRLAQDGQNVSVVAPPTNGQKIGECIPAATNRLFRKLNLPPVESGLHQRIGGVTSRWAGKLRREDFVGRAEGYSWRLNRASFERTLESFAVNLGVKRIRAKLRQVARHSHGRWKIETHTGDHLSADWVIDATGRNAAVAKKCGANRQSGPALVAVWAVGAACAAATSRRTFIESEPDGWWYGALLPDNRPLAIFHTSPELASQLMNQNDAWRRRLRRAELISEQLPADHFESIPLRSSDARQSRLVPFHGDGWVACGDAALSFDPLGSQGIFNALATGLMAAEALVATNSTGAMSAYVNRLSQIRILNERRRAAYYEDAAEHHGTTFWQKHLTPRADIPSD